MYIYLDNAATTPTAPEVSEAVCDVLSTCWGNPSSLHKPGREAAGLLTSARETVAEALGAPPHELFFTSGGTEANCWAILGTAHRMRRRGKHVITTAIEHDAVLSPFKLLETQGFEVTYLTPGKSDFPTLLKSALRDDTVLVSAMLVNNETGEILPVREMAKIVHAKGNAVFHTDAVQGFLKIPFTASALGADLVTVSAHKIHGPKGIGGLWIKKGVKPEPMILGGGQESGLRAGTEPLHNIVGFAKAAELAKAQMSESTARLTEFQARVRQTLSTTLPHAEILPMGAPHIMSISLPGYKSQVIMNYLDGKGVYVSNSSACKKGGRSHVLEAMGLPQKIIDGTIRVSFSRYNTLEDVDIFCDTLREAGSQILR